LDGPAGALSKQEQFVAKDRWTPDRRSFLNSAKEACAVLATSNIFGPAVALVDAGARLLDASGAEAAEREPIVAPPEIRSQNGVLRATITAAPGRVQLGDFAFPGLLYNGSYVPPVLRPCLGDTMRITFRNQLPDDPSNLHFHGMTVSPRGNSDNVFLHVHPGDLLEYEVRIPADGHQGAGFFWYHPHAHGIVTKQILGGMSGGLVVDGFERTFPIVTDLPERFFLIKHVEIGEGNQLISINGQINPTVAISPGELQFWRIGHIGATLFIRFRIEGMPLYVLATDGHPLSSPRKVNEFLIGPGERIDAVAIGPGPGEYAMRTIAFQNEAWRKPDPAQQLASIVSAGPQSSGRAGETDILRSRPDEMSPWIDEVRSAPIARRRTLQYSKTPDRHAFMIDGQVFNDDRVDQTVKLGNTEEWTIVNTDQQYHSFHVHQTAFLVTEINGASQNERSLRDTFSVPPATDTEPSILKVVIPFTDPVITGRFVYHCHAVDHEDKGMMGIIEVVASASELIGEPEHCIPRR
jgi:suppressor of ftsI